MIDSRLDVLRLPTDVLEEKLDRILKAIGSLKSAD